MGLAGRRQKRQPNVQRALSNASLHETDCRIVRKGRGVILDFLEGCFHLEDLSCGANKQGLGAVFATAEPGATCWESIETAGEKWYYIIEGQLEVLVNETSYLLGEGDCIHFGSGSHVWRNPGQGTTKALVLTSTT